MVRETREIVVWRTEHVVLGLEELASAAGLHPGLVEQIAEHFPPGTRITRPAGGYLLWVELPKRVDATALCRKALAAGVCVLPGAIFSAAGRFKHHLRVSCGSLWSDRIERALGTIGSFCRGL